MTLVRFRTRQAQKTLRAFARASHLSKPVSVGLKHVADDLQKLADDKPALARAAVREFQQLVKRLRAS